MPELLRYLLRGRRSFARPASPLSFPVAWRDRPSTMACARHSVKTLALLAVAIEAVQDLECEPDLRRRSEFCRAWGVSLFRGHRSSRQRISKGALNNPFSIVLTPISQAVRGRASSKSPWPPRSHIEVFLSVPPKAGRNGAGCSAAGCIPVEQQNHSIDVN